jgi:putative metallopeptidase DUF6775
LDFRFIHIYPNANLDIKAVAGAIAQILPDCNADVERPFQSDKRIENARIFDLKQPFERQPIDTDDAKRLYDGFVLQRILAETIPSAEADHVHIIFTDLLTCTFSEEDWRYHCRAVVCGTPSIVSTAGIVEAPAKPREFYIAQLGMADVARLNKQFAGRFIDYDDGRIADAAALYALQALFFFIADGQPFCKATCCLLYNCHWQEELVNVIEKGALCAHHKKMANIFNKRICRG